MRATAGLRRLSAMISAQSATSSRLRSTRCCCASAASPSKKFSALSDARDDLFLGAEVAIEVTGTHAGLGADFLHRGLVEACTCEAGLRRCEDFAPAIG